MRKMGENKLFGDVIRRDNSEAVRVIVEINVEGKVNDIYINSWCDSREVRDLWKCTNICDCGGKDGDTLDYFGAM